MERTGNEKWIFFVKLTQNFCENIDETLGYFGEMYENIQLLKKV